MTFLEITGPHDMTKVIKTKVIGILIETDLMPHSGL